MFTTIWIGVAIAMAVFGLTLIGFSLYYAEPEVRTLGVGLVVFGSIWPIALGFSALFGLTFGVYFTVARSRWAVRRLWLCHRDFRGDFKDVPFEVCSDSLENLAAYVDSRPKEPESF